MFDSVINHGSIPRRRLATGTVISVALHAALISLTLWLSTKPAAGKRMEPVITFMAAKLPPPPPPPPPPRARPKVERRPIKKPDTVVSPKEIPIVKAPEPEPEPPPPDEEDDGVEGGVEGGVKGGVVGGVLGGTLGGQVGAKSEVLPFGEGMTRPVLVEGHAPIYTREALEARVEGVMIAKCVITAEGRLENCRIIKSLPHMEKAVLEALQGQRYKPVTFQGRPVTVDYVFTIRLVMPKG